MNHNENQPIENQPIENQPIEKLHERFTVLNTEKIGVERDLKNARDQLEAHKKTALDQWETDDIKKLEELLKKFQAENEQKRSDYQKHLDAIDKSLQELEANDEKSSV